MSLIICSYCIPNAKREHCKQGMKLLEGVEELASSFSLWRTHNLSFLKLLLHTF